MDSNRSAKVRNNLGTRRAVAACEDVGRLHGCREGSREEGRSGEEGKALEREHLVLEGVWGCKECGGFGLGRVWEAERQR